MKTIIILEKTYKTLTEYWTRKGLDDIYRYRTDGMLYDSSPLNSFNNMFTIYYKLSYVFTINDWGFYCKIL